MHSEGSRLITGRVWKFGDAISTDVMAPHNRGNTMDELRVNTMAAIRPDFPLEVKRGDIIVAGKNFGVGSHREIANEILMDRGIAAIIVESVARLFFRTSIAKAFPTMVAPGITAIVSDGEILTVDQDSGVARNIITGASVTIRPYPPTIERIFRAGGMIRLLEQRYEAELQQDASQEHTFNNSTH